MTITHNGFSFPGLAEEIQFGIWERQVVYQTTFGNKGASALNGERTTRDLSVRVMVYGSFSNSTAILTWMSTADSKIGAVGTLVDTGLTPKTITNVEFVSSKLEEGPLPTAPDGGWMAIMIFGFKQLQPN